MESVINQFEDLILDEIRDQLSPPRPPLPPTVNKIKAIIASFTPEQHFLYKCSHFYKGLYVKTRDKSSFYINTMSPCNSLFITWLALKVYCTIEIPGYPLRMISYLKTDYGDLFVIAHYYLFDIIEIISQRRAYCMPYGIVYVGGHFSSKKDKAKNAMCQVFAFMQPPIDMFNFLKNLARINM
jgi:hypothetical protein